MSELLAHAKDAAARNLAVIPVKPGSKAPAVNWRNYQKSLPTTDELEAWFSNGTYQAMGIICGTVSDNLVMVEFEGDAVRDGIYDRVLEIAAATNLGGIIDRIRYGYEEETPSGGIHWLLKLPTAPKGNEVLSKSTEKKPLIETRGEGGFTVVSPSVLAPGVSHSALNKEAPGFYTLRSGSISTIARLNDEEYADLCNLLRSFDRSVKPKYEMPQEKPNNTDGLSVGDDFNSSAHWMHDVLGPHGWEYLYRDASEIHYLRRPGKTEGISATINSTGNNTLKVHSTSTPMPTDGTLHKFAAYAFLNHDGDFAAATKDLSEKGYGTPMKTIETKETAPPKGLRIYKVDELATVSKEKRLWPVEGLIPPGVSLLFADPKQGKSYFILQTAMAVASGTKAFDIYSSNQGDVLYLALEDYSDTIEDRIKLIYGNDVPNMDHLGIVPKEEGCPLLEDGGYEELANWIESVDNPSLIIIDVWQKVRQDGSANGNAYRNDYSEVSKIQDFAIEHNINIILVHHTNKAQVADDPFNKISGTNAISGGVDTMMYFARVGQEDTHGHQKIMLKQRGRRVDEEKYFIYDKQRIYGRALLTSTEQEQVYEVIRQFGPQSVQGISAELNIRHDAARQRLYRMLNRGQLIRKKNYGQEDTWHIPGEEDTQPQHPKAYDEFSPY